MTDQQSQQQPTMQITEAEADSLAEKLAQFSQTLAPGEQLLLAEVLDLSMPGEDIEEYRLPEGTVVDLSVGKLKHQLHHHHQYHYREHYDVLPESTTGDILTHAQALALLKEAGISVSSTGHCSD